VKASVVRPQELDQRELDRWREFQSANLSLQTPFLSPEFALAVDAVCERTRVVVVEDGPNVVGFMPIELRSRRVAAAIGRRINTRQGFVHLPGLAWCWTELLRATGLDVLELPDLIGDQRDGGHFLRTAAAPVIDTFGGWSSYLEGVGKRKSIKTILYKERKLRRDENDVTFHSCAATNWADLDQLTQWKSRQYRRSGWPDLFARRDVVALLHRLIEDSGAGLYCIGSSLSVGGRPIACDLSLATDTVFAGWFGAHDPSFARSSPGAIRTLRTIEAAFDRGARCIDLSRGDEKYKDTLKTDDRLLATGFVARHSPRALAYQARHRSTSAATSYVLTHPEVRSFVRESLKKVGETRELLAGRRTA